MAQIGTIRLQTQNSGTVSVPVFDVGDSGSSVYEFLRVQTAGGTGFIPLVDPADASYDYLRVQSQNQGVVAVHNESQLVNILTHYLEDDFDDNELTRPRTNQEDGTYEEDDGTTLNDARYRPDWDVDKGSPNASNGRLVLANSEAVSTSSSLDVGEISYDFQYNSISDTTGINLFSYLVAGGQNESSNSIKYDDGLYIDLRNDSFYNGINAKEVVNGSSSTLISGSRGQDTNNHSTRLTRDSSSNVELFFDGESEGTGVDSVSDSATDRVAHTQSESAPTVNIDNMIVE